MLEDNFAKAGRAPNLSPARPAETRTFTTSDGVEHFARVIRAKTAEVATLVYLHGIEGHSFWFEETAEILAAQGITTYALDRRGAGMSREPRGDLRDWRRLVMDIEETVNSIAAAADTPLFLMANCWGAKAAIVAVADAAEFPGCQRHIKGLILTSPAIAVQVDVDLPTKLQIGLSYLLRDGRLFPIPLLPEHFTDNPTYLDFIRQDELRLKDATASFFLQSLILTRRAQMATSRLKLPVLLLQSGRDGIVVVSKIEKWFSQVAAADKKLEMFPAAAHSLDFEAGSERQRYLQVLGEWLLERAR